MALGCNNPNIIRVCHTFLQGHALLPRRLRRRGEGNAGASPPSPHARGLPPLASPLDIWALQKSVGHPYYSPDVLAPAELALFFILFCKICATAHILQNKNNLFEHRVSSSSFPSTFLIVCAKHIFAKNRKNEWTSREVELFFPSTFLIVCAKHIFAKNRKS
jgi:hypothetical protein